MASATVTANGSCEGQAFTQALSAYGDLNWYTLAPGGAFNSASEGWTLKAGATVVQTSRPVGGTGGALYLPAGAEALSPPMCVTLEYAKARVWITGAEGSPVVVSVSYPETKSATKPKEAGTLEAHGGGWALSGRFNVKPRLAGYEEGTREVRFVFAAARKPALLWDLWVDPRMRK